MHRAFLKISVFAALLSVLGLSFDTQAHAKRYRLMCQGDHLHYGSSSGYPRRRHAMRAAIGNWAGFTAFEYGGNYAHWKLAKNKRVHCSRANAGWKCAIEGTPCRRN